MPINVTVTNSEKISIQETIIKVLVLTIAASRLNSIVSLFHLGCHGLYSLLTGHTKNSKLNGFNMKCRL